MQSLFVFEKLYKLKHKIHIKTAYINFILKEKIYMNKYTCNYLKLYYLFFKIYIIIILIVHVISVDI